MAPRESSSHTNRNRSWPGVPNRYSTRSWLSVIRPKSIATVVVCLDSTPTMSSTPMLSSVRYSSVSSGWISLTEPTMVVLPTPKPPATRIFSAIGRASSSTRVSEGAKAIENRLEYTHIGNLRCRHGGACPDEAPVEEVAQQDPHGPDRKVENGGEFGDGDRVLAELNDHSVLRLQPRIGAAGRAGRHDQRDQVELAPGRAGPAGGHRVVPDDRPGILVDPHILRRFRHHHGSYYPSADAAVAAADRSGVDRYCPTRATSIAIS